MTVIFANVSAIYLTPQGQFHIISWKIQNLTCTMSDKQMAGHCYDTERLRWATRHLFLLSLHDVTAECH